MNEQLRPPKQSVVEDYREKHEHLDLVTLFFHQMSNALDYRGFRNYRAPSEVRKLLDFAKQHVHGVTELLGKKGGAPQVILASNLLLGMLATGAHVKDGKVVPADWHVEAISRVKPDFVLRHGTRQKEVGAVLMYLKNFLHDPAALEKWLSAPGKKTNPGSNVAGEFLSPPGVLGKRGGKGVRKKD